MMDPEVANKEHEYLAKTAEKQARRWIGIFAAAATLVLALLWYITG